MLDAARKLRAGRNQDLCDIAAIQIGGAEYYEKTRAGFGRKWQAEAEIKEAEKQLEGEDALNALRSLGAG
jgi:hypothetical protein